MVTEDVAHLISNPSCYETQMTEDVAPHPISNSSYYESVVDCVVTEDVVHHHYQATGTNATRHDYEKVG